MNYNTTDQPHSISNILSGILSKMPTHYLFDEKDNLIVLGLGVHLDDPAYDADNDTDSEAEQAVPGGKGQQP